MKIKEIQQHVTYFSEELRLKATQEEEVTMGGIIQNIVPPIDEAFPMYIVTLDDYIGTFHAVVPSTMMEHYQDKFQLGEFVFVNGFVNIVNRSTKKDVSIFVYDLKDITKVEDVNS